MREYSVAATVTSGEQRGVADYVFANAANRPDHPAIRRQNTDGDWVDVSSTAFADEVLGRLARPHRGRDRSR